MGQEDAIESYFSLYAYGGQFRNGPDTDIDTGGSCCNRSDGSDFCFVIVVSWREGKIKRDVFERRDCRTGETQKLVW